MTGIVKKATWLDMNTNTLKTNYYLFGKCNNKETKTSLF